MSLSSASFKCSYVSFLCLIHVAETTTWPK